MGDDENMTNFYPKGLEEGKMKLSKDGLNINRFNINRIKVFIPVNGCFIQSFRYKGHDPHGFIDVAKPNKQYKFMKEKEIHIGLKGEFQLEKIFDSNVKTNRIDIDIPFNELESIIKSLNIIRR